MLTGSRDQRILENRHDAVSTYGLLSDVTKRIARDWIEQLAAQGYVQKAGEYNVLNVTEEGWRVLKGKEVPRLLKPAKKPVKQSKIAKDSWEGVDRALFEELRILRREIADKKQVAAFVVFGDAALRDMARQMPATSEEFLNVKGVGEAKNRQYGAMFLAAIKEYREGSGLVES